MRPARFLLSTCAGLLALLAGCRSTGDGPPLGPRAEIRFEGVEGLTEGVLLEAIRADRGPLPETGPTRAQVDDAAWAIESRYATAGYPFATVSYELVHEGEGDARAARVLFRVEEGARMLVTVLELVGVAAFPQDQIQDLLRPAEGDFVYVAGDVEAGAREIERLYRRSGYLDARVEPPEVSFSEDRTEAAVTVTVVEGPRFLLQSAAVEGPEVLDGERLAAAARTSVGQPYTRFAPYTIRARLLELHAEAGYPDCEVEFEEVLDRESGAVDLRFVVEPGPPVTITAIRVEGTAKVRESLVRNRLTVEPGERYDSRAIRESFEELYRTGLFDVVRIDLAEDEEGERRTLVVRVEESPTREFFLEPGYGSYEGPRLKAGVLEKDFLGKAIRLRGEGTISPRARGGSVSILQPRLLGSRFGLGASVFGDRREEPSFTVRELGTRISLSRGWTERLRSSLQYELRSTELEDVEVQLSEPPAEIAELLRQVDISSVAATVTHDTRDHPLLPRNGTRTRASLEWASALFGSEVDFLSLQLWWAGFHELSDRSVAGFAWRSGAIAPVGGTETIPLQERFFNGGENTVRSFREDKLGPLDPGGEPRGGEAFHALTAELRSELVGNLSGALFLDAGNVQERHEEFFRADDFRFGLGTGLRYLLPIGPLRVDAAWNPNPRDGEDRVVVHFAVGMAF